MGHLSSLAAGDSGELNAALRRGAIETRQAGLAVVLSDFLDEEGYEAGLKALLARGFQVMAVQILSEEELNPASYGDLKFVDAETGGVREVTFGKYRLSRYQESTQAYIEQLSDFCRTRGIGFWSASSACALETLLLKQLKEGEFWR